MHRLIALSLILSLNVAYADGLLPPKQPEVIEVKMPDGTTQQGFIKDGVFVPLVQSTPAQPLQAAVKVEAPQIDITYTTTPLSSRLRKAYTGYMITVANNSKTQVELMNGEVVNGVNGQAAALGAQKSSAAAIGTTIGTGVLTGFLTFGITTAASLVASPFIYGANKHKNNKAISEGAQYANQVSTGVLNPGDSMKLTTLVPVSQKPQLKLSFRNIQTGDLFTVSK